MSLMELALNYISSKAAPIRVSIVIMLVIASELPLFSFWMTLTRDAAGVPVVTCMMVGAAV